MATSRETRQRLEKCWSLELDWNLFPDSLKEVKLASSLTRVSFPIINYKILCLQGCFQVSTALCIPPVAVLGGLVTLTSYVISPSVVQVPGTEWREPVLVWLSINMPTGSSKSSLYQFLNSIITKVRKECGCTSRDPAWLLGEASCEKMGDLMDRNGGRLLGLYDELSTLLTQLNPLNAKTIYICSRVPVSQREDHIYMSRVERLLTMHVRRDRGRP